MLSPKDKDTPSFMCEGHIGKMTGNRPLPTPPTPVALSVPDLARRLEKCNSRKTSPFSCKSGASLLELQSNWRERTGGSKLEGAIAGGS